MSRSTKIQTTTRRLVVGVTACLVAAAGFAGPASASSSDLTPEQTAAIASGAVPAPPELLTPSTPTLAPSNTSVGVLSASRMCSNKTTLGVRTVGCVDPGDFVSANIRYSWSVEFPKLTNVSVCTVYFSAEPGLGSKTIDCAAKARTGGKLEDFMYATPWRGGYTRVGLDLTANGQSYLTIVTSPKNQ